MENELPIYDILLFYLRFEANKPNIIKDISFVQPNKRTYTFNVTLLLSNDLVTYRVIKSSEFKKAQKIYNDWK